ncbi:MAG: hypothetical protein Q3979_03800 [Actinomycetaceae bacterium]|nr:hypothetical protein [Actinomycetaceae bacterium]
MSTATSSWGDLSPTLQNLVIAACACQTVLLAAALTLWLRRPASAAYPPNTRYVWLAVILLGSILGCLVFLLVRPWGSSGTGRAGHDPSGDGHGGTGQAGAGHEVTSPTGSPGDVVDLLYGQETGR